MAPAVAPGLRRLGAMLPTTPLHALLLAEVGRPLVCTSGNRHTEPIVLDPVRARDDLALVADWFLVHDRAVVRRADDSVVAVVDGRVRTIRAGRGLRPLELALPAASERPILATGGHLKCAPALAFDGRVVLWPHVGDLDTPGARAAFEDAVADLPALLRRRPGIVATDAHPDYASTRWAEASGLPVARIHHHHAHVAACLAEHDVPAALGFAWDGVGLGPDGTAWGGEALAVDRRGATRVTHLRPFVLPGGDAAARDGRRALAGLLEAARLPSPDPGVDWLRAVARSPRLSPTTTSVGRLFDAVAALVGLAVTSSYEGEAAIRLEDAAGGADAAPYPFAVDDGGLDWRPMLAAMLAERHDPEQVSARFHATLSAMIVDVARARGADTVALGGGCFHNARLLAGTAAALRERGIRPLAPERLPAGDGGLALGQALIAAHRDACRSHRHRT